MKVVTGRNEVVAKVIFLQLSVCPQGGRVSASVHAGMPYHPPGMENPPGMETPPRDGEPPLGWRTPPDGEPPPGSRLQHTVYERPVRILLECILVLAVCERNPCVCPVILYLSLVYT